LSFGKSLERTLGNISAITGGYVCFIVMDLTGQGSGLTTAKIFATMDLMQTLRTLVFFLGISLGFYFELRIIFDRFCTILNIENRRMMQIDPNSKKTILAINPEMEETKNKTKYELIEKQVSS